jgi:hypothetical protein
MILLVLGVGSALIAAYFTVKSMRKKAYNRAPYKTSGQGELLTNMMAAAQNLHANPDGMFAKIALNVIGSGFTSVILPEDPMKLDEETARTITKQAAGAMSETLKVFHQAATIGVLCAENATELGDRIGSVTELSDRLDSLWLELAAAQWETVKKQEEQRVLEAKTVLNRAVVVSAKGRGLSPDKEFYTHVSEFLDSIAQRAAEGEEPEAFRKLLAREGVGVHHAQKAISEIITELN